MGVGADDEARPPVAEMAHGHLLGRGLAVHVDDHRVEGDPQRRLVQGLVHGGEGVVQGVHVHPAQHRDHQHPPAARRVIGIGPAPRGPGQAGIVQGPQQPGLPLDIGERLPLVPAVVAQRQAVRPRVEQVLGGLLGDAEARGGVLRIDADEVEGQAPLQPGQVGGERVPSGLADHVAEKCQPHGRPYASEEAALYPSSVRTPSSRWSWGPMGRAAQACPA